jgi:hypothetical protein
MPPADFDSWGSIKGGEMTFLGGAALSWINIYSVDHFPNPIDVGGITIGIQLGAGWTPGRFFLLESLGIPGQQTATAAQIENALRAKIGAKALTKYIR